MKLIRPIAMYLPQFHPVPENDEWWGMGFTEWTNVKKATPLFKGHYQPHIPADLGYYDLRDAEAREAQATLAEENGIYGFCYYHYWFNGKRMLERPFNEVLAKGKPDFPFMLCWANENWTRTWDGQDKHVLLEQKYSEDDDRAHIRSLIPVFKDPRYIKVKGKPVFSIYKSHLLPNPSKTIQIWREEARKHGIELYLCCFESFGNYGKIMMEPGYDAAVDFQPFSKELDKYFQHYFKRKTKNNFLLKVKRKYFKLTNQPDKGNLLMNTYRSFLYGKMDYNKWVDYLKANYLFSNEYVKYPGATPAWDNTARKGENGFMLHNANPQKFKEWLSFIYENYKPPTEDENFIFINAWNEWAEGNHLEPCVKFGHQNLDAVKEVFSHDA